MEYASYLQTPHWKKKRTEKLSRKSACQICESTKYLNIHHKRYYLPEKIAKHEDRASGSILFREEPRDLITLCASCHKLWHLHYGKAFLRHKICSKIRRLIRYGCQPDMAIKLSKENDAYNIILKRLVTMAGV